MPGEVPINASWSTCYKLLTFIGGCYVLVRVGCCNLLAVLAVLVLLVVLALLCCFAYNRENEEPRDNVRDVMLLSWVV